MTKVAFLNKWFAGIVFISMIAFSLFLIPEAKADLLDDVVKGGIKLMLKENYKLRSSVNGSFTVKEGEQRWNATYQMVGGSQLDNTCGIGCKEAHELSFSLYLKPQDLANAPFASLNMTASMSLLSYDQGNEIYFKLNDLNINASGLMETEKESYNRFLVGLDAVKVVYMNKWIYLNAENLSELYAAENFAFTSPQLNEDLLDILKNSESKSGREVLKAMAEKMVNDLQTTEELSPDEGVVLLQSMDELMNAKLFRTFDIVTGDNAGFKRSILNRSALSETIEKMMLNLDGSTLSETEKKELQEGLNKVSFSVWYRFNATGVMDIFSAYFEVNDIEELEHFDLRYRQQLWGEGQANVPNKPSEAIALADITPDPIGL